MTSHPTLPYCESESRLFVDLTSHFLSAAKKKVLVSSEVEKLKCQGLTHRKGCGICSPRLTRHPLWGRWQNVTFGNEGKPLFTFFFSPPSSSARPYGSSRWQRQDVRVGSLAADHLLQEPRELQSHQDTIQPPGKQGHYVMLLAAEPFQSWRVCVCVSVREIESVLSSS